MVGLRQGNPDGLVRGPAYSSILSQFDPLHLKGRQIMCGFVFYQQATIKPDEFSFVSDRSKQIRGDLMGSMII